MSEATNINITATISSKDIRDVINTLSISEIAMKFYSSFVADFKIKIYVEPKDPLKQNEYRVAHINFVFHNKKFGYIFPILNDTYKQFTKKEFKQRLKTEIISKFF